jgi:hypothetical protein
MATVDRRTKDGLAIEAMELSTVDEPTRCTRRMLTKRAWLDDT